MSYRIKYSPRVRRELQRLPEKITTTCVEFIRNVIAENPHRVGKPLRDSWEGHYSARRADWRIIYRIDDGQVLIEIVTISHRSDAYRPR